MFRNRTSSPQPQNHLRRCYHAVGERQRSTNLRTSDQNWSLDGQDGLELSMHRPSQPFGTSVKSDYGSWKALTFSGNRFDIFTQTSSLPKWDREHYVPPYQRSRNTRGSKEAKRRRDARRNRRKLQAAQMLDNELSQGFERTLSQANIQRPQHHNLPQPTPIVPTTTLQAPQPVRMPPTPPQLPYFNFGGLDLINDIPQLTPPLTPPSPQPLTPTLPSWCPDLPSLLGKNTKWSDFPLFFDLSKLPEPVESPKRESKGQELQVWQPLRSPQPKKHSRFFPPPSPPKPNVRLPPTGCKLHATNNGSGDASISKPKTLAESVERTVQTTETAKSRIRDQASDASAANLWKILTAPERPSRGDNNELYCRNTTYQPTEEVFAAPFGAYDHRLEGVGMPIELDSTAVPYVHANSLTGHANERGREAWPQAVDSVIEFEAPGGMTPAQEPIEGLNELMVDPLTDESYANAVLAALDLPPLPPSPDLEDTAPLVTDPMPTNPARCDCEETLAKSDAHFKSEQALFNLQSPTTKWADEDRVDVATFLTMGHATNCWCNDCDDPPELINADTFTEEDGWMVYSASDETRSPSLSSAWESEWGTIVQDEETEVTRRRCSTQPEWDELFSWRPSSVAHGAW